MEKREKLIKTLKNDLKIKQKENEQL